MHVKRAVAEPGSVMDNKKWTKKQTVLNVLMAVFFFLAIISLFVMGANSPEIEGGTVYEIDASYARARNWDVLSFFVFLIFIGLFATFAILARKADQERDSYQIKYNDKEYDTEREKQANQKRQANLIGDAKYIDAYERQLHLAKTIVESWKFAETNNLRDTNAQAQTSSWAIHGGFADAIAGPAAGVAVALDIQRQNAEAEAQAATTREEAFSKIGFFSNSRRNAEHEQERLESIEGEIRSFFKGHETDVSNPYGKFVDIVTRVGSINIENGAIHVNVQASISSITSNGNRFFKFNGTKGILDGSLRVIAKRDGEPIGEGFYNIPVPNFSANKNWKYLWDIPGLPHERDIEKSTCEVVLIPFAGKRFTYSERYTIDIEPYHLWYIDLKLNQKEAAE